MRLEKDMKIMLTQKIFDQLVTCVQNASPNEACGLIFGDIEEIENPEKKDDFLYHYTAKFFECIESTNKSPVAFLMDDENELKEISDKISQEYNLKLISIFHSHPAGASPSGVDEHHMKTRYNSDIKKIKHTIWTIMSAQSKELNAFVYLFDELTQIVVEIN